MGTCCAKIENSNQNNNNQNPTNNAQGIQSKQLHQNIFPNTNPQNLPKSKQTSICKDQHKDIVHTSTSVKKPSKPQLLKTSTLNSKTWIQPPKITAEEVDKCINNLVEKNKKCHKKSQSESNNTLHYSHINNNNNNNINNNHKSVYYDEDDMTKDFLGDNRDILNTFSDISSTIHLTSLTKDFCMSMNKVRMQNINSINNAPSVTWFNVLEELEDNCQSSLQEHAALPANPVKIFVTNLLNKQQQSNTATPRKISIILNTSHGCNIMGTSKNRIVTSDGNVIVNRSGDRNKSENYDGDNERMENKNNIAQWYSRSINMSSLNITNNNNLRDTDKDKIIERTGEQSSCWEINYENIYKGVNRISFEECKCIIQRALIKSTSTVIKFSNVNWYPVDWKEKIISGNIMYPNNFKSINYNTNNFHNDITEVFKWNCPLRVNAGVEDDKDINKFSFCLRDYNSSAVLSALVAIINYDNIHKKNTFNSWYTLKDNNKNKDNQVIQFKLHINGAFKIVCLDTLLPYSIESNELIFSKIQCPSANYPVIINLFEKLMFTWTSFSSSFDSTFSIECYHWLGWIPETYEWTSKINYEIFFPTWYTHYISGNILICFSWTDNYDSMSIVSTSWAYDIYYPVIYIDNAKQYLRVKWLQNNTTVKQPDALDIPFKEVTNYFNNIYLSWNPSLYKYTKAIESSFIEYTNKSKICLKEYDENYSLEYNTQFILRTLPHTNPIEIKLFIVKYIDSFNCENNRISYKLFKYDGYKIIHPNCNVLRTYKTPKREKISDILCFEPSNTVDEYVIVILKKTVEPSSSARTTTDEEIIKFKIHWYSDNDFDLVEIPKTKYFITRSFTDIWNASNTNNTTTNTINEWVYDPFLKFPQFVLDLSSVNNTNHLQIKLETTVLSNLMVSLIPSNGRHLLQTSSEEFSEQKSPSFFSSSFSYLETIVPDGKYWIWCLSNNVDNNTSRSIIGNFTWSCNTLNNQTKLIKITRIFALPQFSTIERAFGSFTRWNNRGDSVQKTSPTHNNINSNEWILKLKNPSYEFTISSQYMNCSILLRENNNSGKTDFNSTPHIYFALYKVEDPVAQKNNQNNFTLIYDGREAPCSYWGSYWENISLNPGKYILIWWNHIKMETQKYEIIIQSNYKIQNFKEYFFITPRKNKYEIMSKWIGDISGSAVKYLINCNRDNICDFEIIANKAIWISLVIIEINGEFSEQWILSKNSIPECSREIFLVKDFKWTGLKNYLLLPFSNDKLSCNININVNSNEVMSIKEVNVRIQVM